MKTLYNKSGEAIHLLTSVDVSDFIKVVDYTSESITTAGGQISETYIQFNLYDGYKAIDCTFKRSNNNSIQGPYNLTLNGSNVKAQIKNTNSSSQTYTITVSVIYMKVFE